MSCLALNASFEPLTIVPTRRAIRLVLDRKAEILEVDEKRVFRSATEQLPCPSVIRLVRYVQVPRRFRRQVTKAGLFKDLKRGRFYESPSVRRRRKDKVAARRKVKAARRAAEG